MIALNGHIYAQIIKHSVVWIFTDADLPEWLDTSENPGHDYHIKAVDITAEVPMPQLGWSFNAGVFSVPIPDPLTARDYKQAAMSLLNVGAAAWDFDSMADALTFVSSSVAKFKADALALQGWNDLVLRQFRLFKQGSNFPASIAGFLAALPAKPARPVVVL